MEALDPDPVGRGMIPEDLEGRLQRTRERRRDDELEGSVSNRRRSLGGLLPAEVGERGVRMERVGPGELESGIEGRLPVPDAVNGLVNVLSSAKSPSITDSATGRAASRQRGPLARRDNL
jgi:hypothetical protein